MATTTEANALPPPHAPVAWTDTSTRERIAGSPLVPDCVKWAADGRVAVVSDASIVISTFKSRELEMFLQQTPAVSKSFIFLPEKTEHERVPIPIPVFSEVITTCVWSLLHAG